MTILQPGRDARAGERAGGQAGGRAGGRNEESEGGKRSDAKGVSQKKIRREGAGREEEHKGEDWNKRGDRAGEPASGRAEGGSS